jgi:type I restriction enzyme S subunit
MPERRTVRLRDVATDVTVGFVGSMASEYVPDGIPFLRSLNVRPHRIDTTDLRYITPEFHARLKKSSLRPGDVVTVRTGAPGQSAVVPAWLVDANCSDLVVTRPGPELNAHWLSYYLNWITSTDIAAQLVGAVQQHFNVRSAEALMLELPALDEQQAIAEVLGALDDKMAANARVLKLTDELVRARFGVLRGRPVPFHTFADHVRLQVDPANAPAEEMYVGLEHVPRRHMWLTDHGRAESVSSAKARFEQRDVLFGKLRPYFHKIVAAPTSGVASTDILVLRAKNPALSGFVLACASSDEAVRATTAASEGTRMPRTKWADLAAVEFPWPGDIEVGTLSSEVSELSDSAASLVRENKRLAATRDELLPLLMSGRVTVRDAEEVAEAAT